MLTTSQRQLLQAIERLDVDQVNQLLTSGVPAEFVHDQQGRPLSQWGDQLFDWWQAVSDAQAAGQPLNQTQKDALLRPYQQMFDALVAAGANVHLWDTEEFYGVLWDAASAACVPIVQQLLDMQVNPNSIDDDDLPILSSVCDLWFECDFEQIDLDDPALQPEQRQTLQLLRQYGARTRAELDQMQAPHA